jgi:transcriptional regulator with XRE-family HTH domain
MSDQAVGRAFRAIRVRGRRRQGDIARLAGISRWTVARIERGRLESVALSSVRAVARTLDMSVDLVVRWEGAGLDRIIGAGHDALHEAVSRLMADQQGWLLLAEVSFSTWGERGVIDVLAWHAASRTILVIELKTEIVEAGRLIAQVDRYRRLTPAIARDRGWNPERVAAWVVVADSRTNRRRLADHLITLRAAFPDDGRTIRGWLRNPDRAVSALSFLSDERAVHLTRASDRRRRVRVAAPAPGSTR